MLSENPGLLGNGTMGQVDQAAHLKAQHELAHQRQGAFEVDEGVLADY
jgi:hypothetical protein